MQDLGSLTAEFDFAGSGVHTFDNRKGLQPDALFPNELSSLLEAFFHGNTDTPLRWRLPR